MKFIKYQACGNDYVYIDCFENEVKNPSELSKKISDRHFGVGSDGMILVLPSDIADAKMRIFNSDGSEANMCGNGIRCVGKFLLDEKNVKKSTIKIETLSGIKELKLISHSKNESQVEVKMGKPQFLGEVLLDFNFLQVKSGIHVSMGNPHLVLFCESIENLDVELIGEKIQKMDEFSKNGINVEFVKICSHSKIDMKVCERGSGETLACGTGACASSFASILKKYCNNVVNVKLRGGNITVKYTNNEIYMTGNAVKIFSGEF